MAIIISINYFVGPLFLGLPRSTFRFPQRHGSMGRPLAPQRTRARTRSPPRDESACGRRRGGHGELQRRGGQRGSGGEKQGILLWCPQSFSKLPDEVWFMVVLTQGFGWCPWIRLPFGDLNLTGWKSPICSLILHKISTSWVFHVPSVVYHHLRCVYI